MCPMAGDESLSEGEELVLRLHPHWKTLLRPLFTLAVLFIAVIALLLFLPQRSSRSSPLIPCQTVRIF